MLNGDSAAASTEQDSTGAPMGESDDGSEVWKHRVIPITDVAPNTVFQTALGTSATTPAVSWDTYYANMVIVHADGSVGPLFTGQSGISSSLWGGCGSVGQSLTVDLVSSSTDPALATSYFLDDHLGTTQMELSSGGWPLWQGQFTPFGQEIINGSTSNYIGAQSPDGTSMRFKFTGKERDTESGLDNFGARYFGSSMGRFMSPDPMGGDLTNPQSLNRYAYVLNNPLRFTDPTGLYVCKDGQDCSAFEKTLEGLRNSKNADVARAANAYCAAGEKNGVTVGFADLGKAGEDGVTKSSLGVDANGKLQAQSDVTINSKASGASFDAAVGHEGSHVADAQAVVGSIVVDAHGNFTVGNNITQYQSEQRAYGVTNAILSSEGVPATTSCGVDPCRLGQGVMQGQVPAVADRIINYGYSSGGKPMGPKNQGNSVVNRVSITPKATVPQVPH